MPFEKDSDLVGSSQRSHFLEAIVLFLDFALARQIATARVLRRDLEFAFLVFFVEPLVEPHRVVRKQDRLHVRVDDE